MPRGDEQWFEKKWTSLCNFGILAVFGAIMSISAFFISDTKWANVLFITGFIVAMPWILYFNILTIWHWKYRYKGQHSDLWGALMLIETTGWFRTAYMLRHVWPDRKNKGRYKRFVIPKDESFRKVVDADPETGNAKLENP